MHLAARCTDSVANICQPPPSATTRRKRRTRQWPSRRPASRTLTEASSLQQTVGEDLHRLRVRLTEPVVRTLQLHAIRHRLMLIAASVKELKRIQNVMLMAIGMCLDRAGCECHDNGGHK